MNARELITLWNRTKKTKYEFTKRGKDEPTGIMLKVSQLIEVFGEDTMTEYYKERLNETNDMRAISEEYLVKEWKKPKVTFEEASEIVNNVQKKQETTQFSILGALSSEIVSLMGKDLAEKINSQVEKKLDSYIQDKVLMKVVEYKDEHKQVKGVVHEQFETIMKFVAMDEPVMLTGPAGTGKNFIAKQVADALGLEFYFSNAVTQEYKITGYGDANGNFVSTQFYEAFTKGGLFLLDEMDASCPEALIVLNCAIANRYFDFPVVGRVQANENFRVIANANTFGTGATMEYVGRNQLDGATLNRFAMVEVNYDKRIEDNVCPDLEIANFCREFRNICQKNGVYHIVSYREMSRLYKMIDIANLDKQVALKTCLLKGLENDTLRMICNDMKESTYKEVLRGLVK